MINITTSARVNALSAHAGAFQAYSGAAEDMGDHVGLYTSMDYSTKMIFKKEDVILAEEYTAENKSVFDTTLFVRKGAKLKQITTKILEGEVGILASCSAGGCSRNCPPGQNCSCSSGPRGCSCTECL